MAHTSPLNQQHRQAEALIELYGPPDAGVEVVATFGELESEYAALRKGCVLLDMAQRGTLRVTGPERLDFLNRMLTQKLDDLSPWHARRSFWLSRKGRIDADMRLIATDDEVMVDLDIHSVERAVTALDGYLFAEEVTLADATDETHRLALHGPHSIELLAAISEHVAGVPIGDLSPGRACRVKVAGHEVLIDRADTTGEIGLELLAEAPAVTDIYQQLVEVGSAHDGLYRLRPAGWHAYNIARIEAGTPCYMLDFGPDSLPNETGVLHDRVSFSKGCYLGQEIVARIDSHGGPKQHLVAIRAEAHAVEPKTDAPIQPITGSQLYPIDDPESDAVGVVTSSAISPMLGATPICFAMVKADCAKPGEMFRLEINGASLRATVQPELTFWKPTS